MFGLTEWNVIGLEGLAERAVVLHVLPHYSSGVLRAVIGLIY